VGELVDGAVYPLRALGLLGRTRGLWGYVLLPLALNLLVGATVYAGMLFAGLGLIDGLVAGLPDWAAPLGVLLRALLVVGLLVGTGFVLVRFGVVLGAPWYGRLSERIELMRLGRVPPSGGGVLRDLGRALAYEAKKLLLVVAVGVPLLLLNLIPVVGQGLAAVGGLALAATVACLDFFDSPLERRGLGFRAKLGYAGRGLPASAGFGLACVALTSLPFLNLLFVPLCVAAGTLFCCDHPVHTLRRRVWPAPAG
jgi:CysZ protein